MDFDNLFILIIIFSFIARAIGEAMKGGKKGPGQQPGQRPQRPGLPQQRPGLPGQRSETAGPQARFPVERAPAEAPAPRQSAEDVAADLIPDDLWQILTGTPKPRRAPPPSAPQPGEADVDEEMGYEEVEAAWEATDLTREDREAQELLERRADVAREHERTPETYQPVIVSMETEPAPTPMRHAAFHQKIDQPQVLPGIRRRTAPTVERLAGSGRNALRRAMVLQEVLGKPKGLE